MPGTYEKIQTNSLGSSTSSVTFTSISQSYTDLVVVINGQSSNGNPGYIGTRFNNDATTVYSTTRFYGDGTSADSDRSSSVNYAQGGTFWGSEGTVIFQIQNYSNNTTYKTYITRDNNAFNRTGLMISLYRNTIPITSMNISCPDGAGFASGTTFTIYGIKAA